MTLKFNIPVGEVRLPERKSEAYTTDATAHGTVKLTLQSAGDGTQQTLPLLHRMDGGIFWTGAWDLRPEYARQAAENVCLASGHRILEQ